MAETVPIPAEPPQPLDVGQLIGDTYELVRVIGRGGMGEVWAARHRRLPGKLVALKVLHTGGKELTADALARFRREAEIASRIGHPNIVQVLDFNTLPSGAPYLVLELLQGESLASKLRFGPLGVDEAVSIARQTGSALKAAHALGIVHRDLKPDNVFLVATPMGTMVKVLDFGISKVRDSTTVQTQEAVLLGTPQYMSPEQAIGANKDVGPQSDVFALGAITYEMLCGQPPFADESVAKVVFQIAYQPHQPLAERKPGLPPRVVQAVERALLKDRAHRYGDIGEFVSELSGKPLEDSGVQPLPQPAASDSGVATPSMNGPAAFAATVTPAPKPPQPAAAPLVDTSKSSSSSSSGAKGLVYSSTSSSSASKKWVAYVVAAGLMVGIGGTSLLAQRQSPMADRALSVEPMAPAQLAQRTKSSSSAKAVPSESSDPFEGQPSATPAPEPKPAPPPPPAPVKHAAMPPPGQYASGAELEALVTMVHQFEKDPRVFGVDNRVLVPVESESAKNYAYALIVESDCFVKGQSAAISHFNQVHDPALRAAVSEYCNRFIGAMLRP